MANFFNEFIEQNESNTRKNILIPSLQRDYVQGGRDYIINAFLDELRSALLGEKRIDLNYIYGSIEQKNSFVPIDGQQRLITLWLLHLYIYTKQGSQFPTELQFDSREFANEFSSKIRENLKDCINSKTLKEEIIDSPWFVTGWQYDTTVSNMLNTLDYISKKFDSNNYNFENISFSFLNIEKQGLTDDIYVKMNGRGRPLSYFENLKSWMDEQVTKIAKLNGNSDNNWQTKIDNKWTDFFWKNRNKNQIPQEEIDDEQIRLFYTLILLYWLQEENDLSKIIENQLKENSPDKDFLIKYLNLNEKDFTCQKAQEKFFTSLRECKELIPLYWIEKVHLFEENTFQFIEIALDNLYEIDSNELLSSELHLFLNERKKEEKEPVSYMYQIAMESATYEKTIPYLIVLINTPAKYRKKGNKDFPLWLRFFRNLIENTSINKDNISKIFSSIKSVKDIAEKSDNGFYNAIIESEPEYNNLEGFSNEQLKEEYNKAKKIIEDSEWKALIEEAELHKLLKGKIWVLFQDKESTTPKQFNDRFKLLKSLYNNTEDKYHFIKVLLSYMEINQDKFQKLYLKREGDNWKKLITDKHLLFDAFQRIPVSEEKKKDLIPWLDILVNTLLLNYSRDDGKVLVWVRKKLFVLWGTAGLGNSYGCVVLNYKKDIILKELEKEGKISIKNQPVPKTDIWQEWNRIFTINETSTTYCWDDKYIYKLDKEKRISKNNTDNNAKETDKYICMHCAGLTKDNLIEKLNEL